jgi:hypothetical protein
MHILGQAKRTFPIVGSIFIIVVLLLGYFFYYTKTPAYSIYIIQKAVEQHDWETFAEHVDTDQVLSSAFDDILEESRSDAEAANMAKNLTESFLQILKPGLVDSLQDCLHDYVETGNYETNLQDMDFRQRLNLEDMKKDTDLNFVRYKDVSYTKKSDNGSPVVGVVVTDSVLKKSFVLDLAMRKNLDGSWQVIKILNLKEYIQAIKRARQEKLQVLNTGVRQKIDSVVDRGETTAKIVSDGVSGQRKSLQIHALFTLHGSKPVHSISGKAYARTADGQQLQFPFSIELVTAALSQQTVDIVSELNPFLPKERAFTMNGADIHSWIVVNCIRYTDGTELKNYAVLPDNM